MTWDSLSPPYSTIVVDPPWKYEQGGPYTGSFAGQEFRPPPYPMMSDAEVASLPVTELADRDAHLYLWTTNRYLRDAHDIVRGWGFKPSQTLVWCKTPRGIGPGGAFSNTTEFVLFCRRGSLPYQDRIDTTWWQWPRGPHSVKPAAFADIVERVSPPPYVELFARQPRLGWDAWGHGHEGAATTLPPVVSDPEGFCPERPDVLGPGGSYGVTFLPHDWMGYVPPAGDGFVMGYEVCRYCGGRKP